MHKALVLGPIGLAGAAGLALAGSGVGPALAVGAAILIAGAVTALFRVGTGEIALFFVGLLAFTITWNGIRVGAAGGGAGTGVSGGAFGDLTMALAFAAVIAHVVIDKRPLPIPRWLFLAGVGLLVAGLLSAVFTPSVAVMEHTLVAQRTLADQEGGQGVAIGVASNMGELLKYELALAVIPVSLAVVGVTPKRARLLVDVWAAGAIVNGAEAVLDVAGLHLGPTAASGGRSAGLTIHPNYLALTCVLALPMALLWLGRSRKWSYAGGGGVLALVGGVAASGSRAGEVAALIAILATLFAVPRLRSQLRVALPLIGVALVVIIMFTKTGSAILHQLRLGGSSDTSGSNYQRSLVNHAAWAQFKARPLEGVGYGVLGGAHDIYLQILDAGGVIGLVSFLTLIGGLAACLRSALSGPLRDEAIVCAIAILAWLANGIFDNQLADKYLYLVPGLLLAIARATALALSAGSRVAAAGALAAEPSPVLDAAAQAGAGVPQALAGAGAP